MNRRGLLTIGLLVLFFVLVSVEPLGAQSGASSSPLSRPLGDISESFTRGSGTPWGFLFFFVLLALLVGGLVYADLYFQRRTEIGIDNPRYLFMELVRVHELTRVERQFLEHFANESDLEDPLPLFVEPAYFLSALDDDRFRESHRTLSYLLKKLFGIEHGDPQSAPRPYERSSAGLTTVVRQPNR